WPMGILRFLKRTPKAAKPVEVSRTTVSFESALPNKKGESFEDANMRKAFQLLAGIGSMVATYHRVRNGRRPVKPDSQLGHAGNFLYLLTAKKPDEYSEWAYDKVSILYADHEMNASTFALRVTCSTLADIGGAVTSAIAAVAGPLP